jgi:hypothetical protein
LAVIRYVASVTAWAFSHIVNRLKSFIRVFSVH